MDFSRVFCVDQVWANHPYPLLSPVPLTGLKPLTPGGVPLSFHVTCVVPLLKWFFRVGRPQVAFWLRLLPTLHLPTSHTLMLNLTPGSPSFIYIFISFTYI